MKIIFRCCQILGRNFKNIFSALLFPVLHDRRISSYVRPFKCDLFFIGSLAPCLKRRLLSFFTLILNIQHPVCIHWSGVRTPQPPTITQSIFSNWCQRSDGSERNFNFRICPSPFIDTILSRESRPRKRPSRYCIVFNLIPCDTLKRISDRTSKPGKGVLRTISSSFQKLS